ncbi:MAG: hypothetical protein AAFR77_14660, partial [Cyanobacteria bacterium J06631_2]
DIALSVSFRINYSAYLPTLTRNTSVYLKSQGLKSCLEALDNNDTEETEWQTQCRLIRLLTRWFQSSKEFLDPVALSIKK